MSHEKSCATILIGAPEIRTAESAIQEFARKVPDPLFKKAGSGNETKMSPDHLHHAKGCGCARLIPSYIGLDR